MGNFSGQYLQGENAVSIGLSSGQYTQGSGAVAIGYLAGYSNQGVNAVAIGLGAGKTGQPDNSIFINASGTSASGVTASSCYIRPIRGVAATTPVMTYDTTNFEVRYNSSSKKYKTDIIDLPYDTSTLYNLNPREFLSTIDYKTYIGFVAEEVEEVDTRFAWKDESGSPESIEWFNMLIYTISEIKKLNRKVLELETKIGNQN
jgi:hypothetical protein